MREETLDFQSFLKRNLEKGILRFITCGSVDDGKSTLIGRLLYDSRRIYDDHLAALRSDSRRYGTQGDAIDFALLVDGLQAEREQGITIDVAYRYFSTEKRTFVIADTPGHEQYTRNMATGASNADLAVILVDARNGIQRQTRRHSRIVSALGIRSIVVAVNKMDLVDYQAVVFSRIEQEYRELLASLGNPQAVCIPISALRGDNVVARSERMAWYEGPTLLEHLESVEVSSVPQQMGARLPVQLTLRADGDYRGYAGTLACGALHVGEDVLVLPAGGRARISSITRGEFPATEARAGDAISVTLVDDVDVGRGSILASVQAPMFVSARIEAEVVWMSERPLVPGDLYDAKVGNQWTQARLERLVSQVDISTGVHAECDQLSMNDIGIIELGCASPVAFDPYSVSRRTGAFILVDRITNQTAGAGMILERSAPPEIDANVVWHHQTVGKQVRAEMKNQSPRIIWFTGLSGAGKSTLANALEKRLAERGYHTYLLDGDNLRHGLNRDLGFGRADRAENIRRVGEVAKLMVDAGLIVLCAFVSPYRKDRDAIRASVDKGEFLEVYVSTPLEVCESRDTKGLYAKARTGEVAHFTGVHDSYERPENPELELDMANLSTEDGVGKLLSLLETPFGRESMSRRV